LNDQTGAMSKSLFFDKQSLTDISFKVGEKVFHAHKAVLSARCKVLATMFTSGFIESAKSHEIEIGETSPEAFEAFIGTFEDSRVNCGDRIGGTIATV
jgi:Rho family protein